MMEGAVFKTWQKWVIVIASLLSIAEFAFDLAQGFARGARGRSASYRSEDSRFAARDSRACLANKAGEQSPRDARLKSNNGSGAPILRT
jgi:hypothetical protein